MRALESMQTFTSWTYITFDRGLYAPYGQSRPPLQVGQT